MQLARWIFPREKLSLVNMFLTSAVQTFTPNHVKNWIARLSKTEYANPKGEQGLTTGASLTKHNLDRAFYRICKQHMFQTEIICIWKSIGCDSRVPRWAYRVAWRPRVAAELQKDHSPTASCPWPKCPLRVHSESSEESCEESGEESCENILKKTLNNKQKVRHGSEMMHMQKSECKKCTKKEI